MNRLLVPLLLGALTLMGCPPPQADPAPTPPTSAPVETPPTVEPPTTDTPPATDTNDAASLPLVTYYAFKG